MTNKTILIDGDSIAYMAGIGETRDDVHRIVDEYMLRITNRTWEGLYELYIEHTHNKNIFRNHVATTKPYKGNRSSIERPKLLEYAKQYMEIKYGARPQTYIESEDMVAIRAYELGLDKVIIASIDKDMAQIPTEFYNYRKDESYHIDEVDASFNFWTQVLTGDATDNIPGLKGIGPKKAKKILGTTSFLSVHVDEILCVLVMEEYINRGHPYQYFVEQCRLLRMLRSRTEVYNPPTFQEYYEKLLTNKQK